MESKLKVEHVKDSFNTYSTQNKQVARDNGQG